jgi:DNA ligase (NAD+)
MDAERIAARLHEMSAGELAELVAEANREYWDQAAATLPDPLYDRMVERLRRLDPEAPVLQALGESGHGQPVLADTAAHRLPPSERFGAPVAHTRAMLSLDKAYTADDVRSWADKLEGDLLVMPKLDGIACAIRYDERGELWMAATRGSGFQGEDVTANVLQIPSVPARIDPKHGALEVRGEVYLTLSAFARYKGEFSNPRNTAAGALRQKERAGNRAGDLSFAAYDVLGLDAASERAKMEVLRATRVPVVEHEIVDRDGIAGAYERWAARRADLDYEIDGIVFRTDLVREQERLGSTAHHPRYAIALKFQGDTGETILKGVEWGVSRTGTITPMAILEPIELSGAMIGRAGLHNLTRFRALGLTEGARVEVTRRGGVIPYIERVIEPGPGARPFAEPDHCPACGNEVRTRQKREGEFLECVDPRNCITARLRELEHFAKVVDIQGFGPKIVAQVVDAGLLDTPADFYRLTVEQLAGLERLAEKSAHNLVERVAKKRSIPLPVFLEALGIDHLGPQNAQLIASELGSLAAVRAAGRDELMAVRGIKDAIADAIVDGLHRRAEIIDELAREVTVEDAPREAPAPAGARPLSGKSFVFTGALETLDRKDAQARVKALGGEAPSGVSKTLTHLVVGAGKGPKSTKQKKAEELVAGGAAIEILGEAEFLAMIEAAEANA